jgi:hypothetical protein
MEPSPTHDGDAGTPPLAEDERRFLAMRTKNASLSHVDHPQSAAELEEEHWKRLNVTFPADFARRYDIFERENPREYKA